MGAYDPGGHGHLALSPTRYSKFNNGIHLSIQGVLYTTGVAIIILKLPALYLIKTHYLL